jgi:hypothetical protein
VVRLTRCGIWREVRHCYVASGLGGTFVVPHVGLGGEHPCKHHDWDLGRLLHIDDLILEVFLTRLIFYFGATLRIFQLYLLTMFLFIHLIGLMILAMASFIIHIMVVRVFIVGVHI